MSDTSTARCHVAAIEREIPHGCGKYIVGDVGETRDAAGTWKANNGLGAWVDVEGIGLVEMWEVEQRDQQLAVASNCDVLEESAFGVLVKQSDRVLFAMVWIKAVVWSMAGCCYGQAVQDKR